MKLALAKAAAIAATVIGLAVGSSCQWRRQNVQCGGVIVYQSG